MAKSIKISKKHGVNPTMLICPVCKNSYTLALLGKLKGDAEAPKEMIGDLCDECKKTYIKIMEVTDAENRQLTGRSVIVSREDLSVKTEHDAVIMIKEEFEKTFVNNERNSNKD